MRRRAGLAACADSSTAMEMADTTPSSISPTSDSFRNSSSSRVSVHACSRGRFREQGLQRQALSQSRSNEGHCYEEIIFDRRFVAIFDSIQRLRSPSTSSVLRATTPRCRCTPGIRRRSRCSSPRHFRGPQAGCESACSLPQPTRAPRPASANLPR